MIETVGAALGGRKEGGARLPKATEGDFLYRRWPKPDFAAIARVGKASPERAALFMAIYSNLAPRPADLGGDAKEWTRLWQASVDLLQLMWEEGIGQSHHHIREVHDETMRRGLRRPELKRVGPFASGRRVGSGIRHGLDLSRYHAARAEWLPKLGWPFDRRLRDDDAFSVIEQRSRTGFTYRLARLDGGRAEILGSGAEFHDRSSAERELRDVVQRILAERAQDGSAGEGTRALGRVGVRVGPPNPRRGARQASTDDLLHVLKMRGVEFGKYLGQGERQAALNETYDAFFDLCSVLRIPAEGASLWGRIGLAFASRGRGAGVSGHFDPKNWVVHVDRSGAGVLAHEMGHAIDAGLAEACGLGRGSLLSSAVSAGWQAHPLARVMREVLEATVQDDQGRQTQFLRDALTLDEGRRPYWSLPEELFARIFEVWVCDALAAKGRRNDFLVFPASGSNLRAGEEWRAMTSNYAKGVERDRLVRLMGAFMEQAMPMVYQHHGGYFDTEQIRVRQVFGSRGQ